MLTCKLYVLFYLQVMKVDFSQYNLMYSLYSWPNVILSLIGGVLIDRFLGVRIGTVVFSSFVTLGQVNNSHYYYNKHYSIYRIAGLFCEAFIFANFANHD